MIATLTNDTLHLELIRDCAAGRLSEDDTLLWMVLLHTHGIHVRSNVVPDVNGAVLNFPPITQRHAADVAAKLWKELKPGDSERTHYTYWYSRYNAETPYEDLGDVPDALLPRLTELRDVLARDSRVAAVTPEE